MSDDRKNKEAAEGESPKSKHKKPVVLIMAGGKGERFWPRSRITTPKQLQKVYSDRTLLEETIHRAKTITDDKRIFVGCNAELRDAILRTHKIKKEQFVVEPEGRNTAPIIALAALELEKRFPGSVHVVLSADHYIAPLDEFKNTMLAAVDVARDGWLVTLGVPPSRPDTGYGYIRAAQPLNEGSRASRIEGFKEKPDETTAKTYLTAGDYYWNSGMFVWSGVAILEQFSLHAPEILGPLRDSYESPSKLKKVFPTIPDQPVDIAIMEKSDRIAMIPASFTWDDVGSWLSLERIVPPDESGNTLLSGAKKTGELAALDSRGNIIMSKKKLIALLGIQDAVLVEEDDLLFLATRDSIPRIKELLAQIRENPGLQKFLE